ncbi:hypothetical protein BH09VER1_BH09VER1_34790 [soil metagenome]
MKTPRNSSIVALPSGRLWIPALAVALALPSAFAEDAADQQSEAYRASMSQGDVKNDAAAIQAELIELRDQMKQLMPGDVAEVDAAIKKIQSLSQNEMGQAVTALQEASRSKDAAQQVQKITGALKSQGAVSTALKQLSVDLQAKEDRASLAAELSELVRREVAICLEIGRLGKVQQTPAALHNRHQERYQVANEDQKGVTADLKLLNRKVDNMSKDFATDPQNAVVQAAAVGLAQKLSESADKAQQLTEAGPFNDAVVAQTQVIITLVAMEKALAAGGDPLDRLRALTTRLQQAGSDQKDIVDAVMLIGDRQDLDRGQKRLQGSLGDEVVAVRFEIESTNNLAATRLQAAQDSIDKSLLNFNRMWEEHMDARVNTQEAQKNIAAALQSLLDQIAAAEKNAPKTPAQLAAQLEQLQKDVAQTALQQSQAARQPQPQTPAQKQAMIDRVNDLQQKAAQLDPAASDMLTAAAQQLPTDTPQAQAAAAQKLAEAAVELQKEKAEVAALAQADAQMAAAQQQIDKAQEDLQKNQTPQAANDLRAAQQAAQAAQQAAQQAAPEAAQALAQANQQLQQAGQAAAQTDAKAAEQKAQAAEAALAQAQAAMGQAMAKQPGMQMAMQMGAGNKVAENAPAQQGPATQSQGNGGNGPSGDNLKGAGDKGGPAEVIDGLNPKDRDAVASLQNEKPPREFVPEVQQYYKNIADGVGLK